MWDVAELWSVGLNISMKSSGLQRSTQRVLSINVVFLCWSETTPQSYVAIVSIHQHFIIRGALQLSHIAIRLFYILMADFWGLFCLYLIEIVKTDGEGRRSASNPGRTLSAIQYSIWSPAAPVSYDGRFTSACFFYLHCSVWINILVINTPRGLCHVLLFKLVSSLKACSDGKQ